MTFHRLPRTSGSKTEYSFLAVRMTPNVSSISTPLNLARPPYRSTGWHSHPDGWEKGSRDGVPRAFWHAEIA
jgi:hypothetical protein